MNKKRILVITGSPRKNGNSDILAESFIEGALQAGHTVDRFDGGRKKIRVYSL
jgi:multimeric flavodoxin WrbA